jgi:hypothetical protein
MEKYLRLFAALERIFGKGYVSRLMGKQSNVITLPDKQARKFLDTELNVMEASEGAVKKGIQDLETVISDTKRLSTLNDQELLTITNNAERLAVKVNPPAPPPAPTADVLSITTKVNKNKDPNVLIDEYNKNQTRLRLTDDEGGTAISYDEFRKLQSRNNEIEKTLESLNVKPALDEVKPEGIVIPFTKKTEDFATGGRVGYAKGGFLKLAMKFFNDNNPVSAYKKYLKYVKETAQKDPAKLAPEVGGIVVGSELIHRGLRRKLKEVKEKNNENDSENLETDSRVGYKKGGITALKTLIKFLAETRGHGSTKGSKSLQAVNPKQFGYKFDMLDPEMKDAINKNRLEYLENLSDVIKADKKLLREMKDLPKEWQDFMYKQANEGGNKGRLDIYNKINIDDAIGDIEQMKKNLEFKNLPGKEIKRRMNAEGGVSQGLDYLMGIERRGYANGDYAVQAGIKNYLGKQKTATVPIKWKSGKDHPDTELAYITKPEKELLIKLDLHGSMKDGKPNKGPGGIISLNSGGSGNGGSGDGGSGGGGTDTGDMGSEAANNAATDAANASAGIGGGPTDTGDLGSEAANNAATAAAAASVGMGTFSPYSRPGMIAKNISNYMTGNPGTSLGLTALGLMMGMPALGVMNAASSIYGGGRSSSSIGSEQSEDGSGDGGDERDRRTFIPSFDTALLTPDLAKNRDYRLYQSANNPFYSMQAVPSDGINNVYTEFQTGGRVGFKKGSFLINTAIDAAKNLSKKKSKKELKRQLTDDEIDDLAADVGDLDAYLDFDGTVGSAEKIRKQHKEYMDYMYYQYKTGRLDPKPGEMNTSRMQYLRNKRKQAEMTDDPKLFNPNERDELDNLEETFSPMGTSNKINISDPKTAESFTEFAKQNDPEGFKKIEKIVDDINNKNTLENFDITGRKKNAGGGLNYLMGL